MNKNIDLTKILDGCPVGTEFYNDTFGKLFFFCLDPYRVKFKDCYNRCWAFSWKGTYYVDGDSECSVSVFSSKDQRDWSKFERFWDKPNIARFNPKTLKPFDKVLVRDMATTKVCDLSLWKCQIFAFIGEDEGNPYVCIEDVYGYCIPYNEETKHLVGTTEEAPEYYRYWEDE